MVASKLGFLSYPHDYLFHEAVFSQHRLDVSSKK